MLQIIKATLKSNTNATNNRQRQLLSTIDLNITLSKESTLQSQLCQMDFLE